MSAGFIQHLCAEPWESGGDGVLGIVPSSVVGYSINEKENDGGCGVVVGLLYSWGMGFAQESVGKGMITAEDVEGLEAEGHYGRFLLFG